MTKGEVIGTGILRTENLKFDDICFAGERLIYSVVGRGIFGIQVEELRNEIPERELLSDYQIVLPLPEAESFFLSWASGNQKLMAAALHSRSGQYDVYEVDFTTEERRYELLEMDWVFGNRDYQPAPEQIKGFSVSEEGEFVSFSGTSLSVFVKNRSYYALTGEPIKTKISCQDTDFSGQVGLSQQQTEFLKERGAVIPGGKQDEQR